MSFGLGHGRDLDDAPGVVGVSAEEMPPLPDEIARDRRAAWVDCRRWFSEPARALEIEIGSGKGTFLLQQASEQPETNFLGIEWAREFYLYTADRVRRRGLGNVRVLHGDATEFLRWRCPDAIARVIHLYFSDPWPKRRHHRRRVVQDSFLADAWRVLVPGGELRIVTDHDEYWMWMREHFARWTAPEASPRFELLAFAPPRSAGEGELVGTNFERKYRREGRPFNAAVLRKPG
jgi:tRNA (guanine-N7-)-methyltransferase